MICNIIDGRNRRFRWRCVNAIVEPTWHDNVCADSDQAERGPGHFVYDHRDSISVADAISWANGLPLAVTLFLYDASTDSSSARRELGSAGP